MTGLIPLSPVVSDAAAVGMGAVCGALCRHHIGKAATERISKDPNLKFLTGWHTAGINILGSFVLGGVFGTPLVNESQKPLSPSVRPSVPSSLSARKPVVSGGTAAFGMTPRMKLLLGVGFCGSFTTFSTYSVDLVNMMGKGEIGKACSYLMVNNMGGVAAAAAGMMVVRTILKF